VRNKAINPALAEGAPGPFRRARALALAPVVWVLWVILMATGNHWGLFEDNWFMTATMCVGSFIAGATSEGGGAVAFPVMTLIFGIEPAVARDFSLMIQSAGMTAASLTIILLRIRVEWRAIAFASIGGAIGIIIGIELIAPLMSPPFVKMFFTSLWLSFGLTLYWLNKHADRKVHLQISSFGPQHACMLIVIGLAGGIVSGLTGSGIDILTFTLLTLFFRLSEKISTPTSVILMALNAVVGFAWSGGIRHQLDPQAWDYFYVCIPVVVVGAPLGAWFINSRTRRFIAGLLVLSIAVQFGCSLAIIDQSPQLLAFSTATMVGGFLLFAVLMRAGTKRAVGLEVHSRADP